MARYRGPKDKIERRIGEKLFLKGERSFGPNAALTKRPYPPGMHGQARKGKMSEFGSQLKSKQKVKNIYRMLEKQFKNTVKSALEEKGKDPFDQIINGLETRLDNFVYRMGLAQSRDQARQLVNHGHITVDGRKTDIASYRVKIGEEIAIREQSKKSPYFTKAAEWLKELQAPIWIDLNKEKMSAKVKGHATMEETGLRVDDLQAIIEYYSR